MFVHTVPLSAAVATIEAPAHRLARVPNIALSLWLRLLLPVLLVVMLSKAGLPGLLFPPSVVVFLVVAELAGIVFLVATSGAVFTGLNLTFAVAALVMASHIRFLLVHKPTFVVLLPATTVTIPAGLTLF